MTPDRTGFLFNSGRQIRDVLVMHCHSSAPFLKKVVDDLA
jgi:hypothetical protein